LWNHQEKQLTITVVEGETMKTDNLVQSAVTSVLIVTVLMTIWMGAVKIACGDELKPGASLPGAASKTAAVQLSAADFDAWVQARIHNFNVERQNPQRDKTKLLSDMQVTEDVLFGRLKNDKFCSTSSIKKLVYAWADWDRLVRESPDKRSYNQAKRTIGTILPLLYDRDQLKAELHRIYATYLEVEENYQQAVVEFQAALDLFTPVHLEVDVKRVSVQLSMANEYLRLKQTDKGEAALLQVLSYDWVKIEDSDAQDGLRAMYVQAGHSLIELRRHHLKELKGTYFMPSTMGILGPRLQAAIKEAGGSQQDIDKVMAGYVY
jgi:hypothetical protein